MGTSANPPQYTSQCIREVANFQSATTGFIVVYNRVAERSIPLKSVERPFQDYRNGQYFRNGRGFQGIHLSGLLRCGKGGNYDGDEKALAANSITSVFP